MYTFLPILPNATDNFYTYVVVFLQVYYYDTKARLPESQGDKKKKSEEPNYFAGVKKLDNKQDVS